VERGSLRTAAGIAALRDLRSVASGCYSTARQEFSKVITDQLLRATAGLPGSVTSFRENFRDTRCAGIDADGHQFPESIRDNRSPIPATAINKSGHIPTRDMPG